MQINVIIFSKNRPAQLDLLLSTIKPYPAFVPKVIYLATEDSFKEGYALTKKRYDTDVEFVEESDMKQQVCSHVGRFTCFMTDDSFIYRTIDMNKLAIGLDSISLGQFSLRLGLNTTDNHGSKSGPPNHRKSFGAENGIIWWDVNDYKPHECYGYKMSLDGHIYSGRVLSKMLEKIAWGNPNQIECQLNDHRKDVGTTIMSFPKSVLVSSPVNRVQEICQNWYGETYPADINVLNMYYLEGKRIQLPQVEPNSTHFECPIYMS